eukprot:scaffold8949_cov75-Cyclotella_meneghiniana.AAC.2
MAASKQMRCWIILPPLLVLFTIFAIKKSSRLIHLDEYKNHLFVDNGEKNVKLSQKKDNVQVRASGVGVQKSRMEIPNYYMPKSPQDKLAFWELNDRDGKINCQIHAHPTRILSSNDEIKSIKSDREQYVIHIHGLHHTGTGYLRQTIQDALNDEFAIDVNSPVASVHDGAFPYLQGLSSTRRIAPENEGQHFQNIFPPYRYRYKTFKEADCPRSDFGKLTYLADECIFDNSQSKLEFGNALFNEWSSYWNMSATFLIQKTPLLDVKFHEDTKVLPTLHVIVLRHPMTSNAFRTSWMGLVWLDAFTHTFDLLAKDEIEWYAVVTYEALIQHHDEVVKELMEVVRSGMKRFGSKTLEEGKRKGRKRRQLHLHSSSATNTSGPLSYLVPKDKSISVWKMCLRNPTCGSLLADLTTDVLPHFGYVNHKESYDVEGISKDGNNEVTGKSNYPISETNQYEESTLLQLSSSPGIVTVNRKFSRVLFTSEYDAVQSIASTGGENKPTSELLTSMKDILANYKKKYPKKKVITKKVTTTLKKTKSNQGPASPKRYWKLEQQNGEITCEIDIDSKSQSSSETHSNQYVIHIHGLQPDHAIVCSSLSSVPASYSYIKTSDGKSRKTRIPENEGQHLQSVFPSFTFRRKLKLGYDFGKHYYVADYCEPKNKTFGYDQIGQALQNQWSPYWNMSATYLLQKTPTLDVHFLERTKVLPTLHVIILRHPMTSNSRGHKWMGLGWLDAWTHTLKVLASGEIEWYAVVTYEALVQYHEVVVKELLEVLRSGMRRLGDDFQIDALTKPLETCGSNNRRLELHASKSTVTYLTPKSKSISYWKTCNTDQKCNTFLKQLTSDIFPSLGYVDVTDSGKNKDELTSNPGSKGISRDFGHVLFSSEGDALKKFKESCENKENDQEGIGYEPSMELIYAMKELLRNDNSPLKGRIHDKE